MNLPEGMLTPLWLGAAWGLFLPLLALALLRANWRQLFGPAFNVWAGFVVVLMGLWSMKAGVMPGLSLHLLGATLFTLVFGPWLALIGLCTVMLGLLLNGWVHGFAESLTPMVFAWNALLMAGVGVGLTQWLVRLVDRYLPHQFFVYVFVNGFFGAGLTVLAVGTLSCLLLVWAGAYGPDYLLSEFLPSVLLLAFSEAWLSGMVLTLLLVYRPEWLASFNQMQYLGDNGAR